MADFYTDIIEAVAAVVADTLSEYDPAGDDSDISRVYTDLSKLGEEKRPHAMIFNPARTSERLDFMQSQEAFVLLIALVRDAGAGVQMRDDVATLMLALEADPHMLNDAQVASLHMLEDSFVSSWEIDEVQANRTVAVLVFEAHRIVRGS